MNEDIVKKHHIPAISGWHNYSGPDKVRAVRVPEPCVVQTLDGFEVCDNCWLVVRADGELSTVDHDKFTVTYILIDEI